MKSFHYYKLIGIDLRWDRFQDTMKHTRCRMNIADTNTKIRRVSSVNLVVTFLKIILNSKVRIILSTIQRKL